MAKSLYLLVSASTARFPAVVKSRHWIRPADQYYELERHAEQLR